MMRAATEPRRNRLPKSFPVGAVYVVEGKCGERGRLDVSARYVVLPGGKRIDVAAKRRETTAAPDRRHLRLVSSGRPATRPKEFSYRTKKISAAAGTTRRETR
jgi:hypothetical protein